MTMTIPCVLGSARQGLPLTDRTHVMLMQALSGGSNTATFFQKQYALKRFVAWVNAGGAAVWTASTDNQGNPIFSAQQPNSPLRMQLSTLPAQQVLHGQQPPHQFTFQGKSYNVVGSLTGTLSYSTDPLWYVEVPLGVAEIVPISQLASIAWAGLVRPLLQGFLNGIRSCFTALTEAGEVTAEVTADAAAAAAEDAAVDAVVVEDVAVSMTAGVAAFAGIALLAAIPIIIELLAHSSYHSIKLYNLTDYDITWSLPYFDEGVLSAAPVTAQEASSYNFVIPARSLYSPDPTIPPVPVVHEADFSFVSTSDFKGIGYAMPFAFTPPDQPKNVLATTALLFDVPWAGDNSLYVTFTPQQDLARFYSEFEGKNTLTQMRSLHSVQGQPITATLTYDYLNSEHPGPDGQSGYIYNSLVVFAPLAT
ncbi:hypothetical protein KDH_01720 [Dictyobacter sp. S3.2.2.5]|uniref:Uncharacterized protein n=1 Tax=Dictyobacter halimunensis TaxID=3026934 RepID=A0ABQ6FLA2_9CHLR|nr:hypothetical protein KDH_01720 [Dictyobacter sp. S3.2.2.5]